jgi:segregation and condensation protein B
VTLAALYQLKKLMELNQLNRIIEAALLASAQPLSVPQLSSLFDAFDMPTHDDLARALHQLQADCAERGIELVEVASGFRYQVRPDAHPFVARQWTERQTRYSRALLETLSLIAYRQPITRAEIEQIRGVAVSTNMVRTLEEREWIRVVGYRDLPGKPALFGTTRQFLDYFNLKSLDQLPSLGEIQDLEEFDPQLAFEASGDVIPASVQAGDGAPGGATAHTVSHETASSPEDLPGANHESFPAVVDDNDAAPSSLREEPDTDTGATHTKNSEPVA